MTEFSELADSLTAALDNDGLASRALAREVRSAAEALREAEIDRKSLDSMTETAADLAVALKETDNLRKAVTDYLTATDGTAHPLGVATQEWWDDPKVQDAMARQDEAYDRMEDIVGYINIKMVKT